MSDVFFTLFSFLASFSMKTDIITLIASISFNTFRPSIPLIALISSKNQSEKYRKTFSKLNLVDAIYFIPQDFNSAESILTMNYITSSSCILKYITNLI